MDEVQALRAENERLRADFDALHERYVREVKRGVPSASLIASVDAIGAARQSITLTPDGMARYQRAAVLCDALMADIARLASENHELRAAAVGSKP